MLLLSQTIGLQGRMARRLVNYEFERSWKETIVAESEYYTEICLEGMSKTTKPLLRSDSVLAEMRTGHIRNTRIES